MALQIVTGYTGTAHIKSAHDRTRNAGVVGTGSYVLKVGKRLSAAMQDANTLRISDGDLMMQGVHATIEAGTHEDLGIHNGTQGKKRNDLVVARYERLAGEPKTESVTLKVIKGAPAVGAAADPAHVEGNILEGDLVSEMPLYRIPIDGLNVGAPVPLFENAAPIDEVDARTGGAGRIFSGTLGKVAVDRNGHAQLWTTEEFRKAFGADPNDCFVAVSNRASGGSGIWLATPRWNGTSVYTTQLEARDGAIMVVPGDGSATLPVAYFVAVYPR